MTESFAERLIYQLFRIATRAAHTFGFVPWKRMKELLTIAAYDELYAQGLNKTQMAARLSVAQGSITSFAKLARDPTSRPEPPSYTRMILDTLDLGRSGQNEWDLLDLVFKTFKAQESKRKKARGIHGKTKNHNAEEEDSLDPLRDSSFTYRYDLALSYLLREKMIHGSRQRSGRHYKLTPKGKKHLLKIMSQPVHEQFDVLEDTIELCQFLHKVGSPLSMSDLFAMSKCGHLTLNETRIKSAIDYSQSLHLEGRQSPIIVDSSGEHPYFSPDPETHFNPEESITEQQMVALRLTKRTAAFIHWLANEPDRKFISMKDLSFKVREGHLLPILVRHRKDFLQDVANEEKLAKNACNVITYHMTWFGDATEETVNQPLC